MLKPGAEGGSGSNAGAENAHMYYTSGRAMQADPMKPTFIAPGSKRSKLI